MFLKIIMQCGIVSCVFSLLLSVFPLYASKIVLYKEFLPEDLLYVDKKSQTCYIYKGNGLDIVKYTCATGQVDGDKVIEGDKKTPEGLYFVTSSIFGGLDFAEYGSRAFPVNFPNPIDQVLKKTGYGIWVHGRGKTLELKSTRGCVAFSEEIIKKLSPIFVKSYPVIIGDTVVLSKENAPAIFATVEGNVLKWRDAWTDRSDNFIKLYSKQRASYDSFVKNKRSLFSRFPFVYNIIEKVNIVEHAPYFVTWFRQYYYAPNMVVEGERRLYWQKNGDNTFSIVGEEWLPDTTKTTKDTMSSLLRPDIESFVEKWRSLWEKSDVQAYAMMYAVNARQGNLRSRESIIRNKSRIWKKAKPKEVSNGKAIISLTGEGIKVSFPQEYIASGYRDYGLKTLIIVPKGQNSKDWKIIRESWSPLKK
ncbi:MAG: L,D-transpeptidase Cds6 family protein [Desulfovibrionaceae bacterium]